MMGIGPFEFIIILAIALVVIGPEKFPEFAKVVMRTVHDLRTYVNETKRELTQVSRELSREIDPVRRELEDFSRHNPKSASDAFAKAITEDNDKRAKEEGGDKGGKGSNGGAKSPKPVAYGSAKTPSATTKAGEEGKDSGKPEGGQAESARPSAGTEAKPGDDAAASPPSAKPGAEKDPFPDRFAD